MRRFFVRSEDVGEAALRLRGDEADHLARVLRLGPGAQIVAFDGHGHDYMVLVERLESDSVICQILHHTTSQPARMLSITLGQGLPKAEKFEWVIQKTTELGVSDIVPVITDRVVPHISLRQHARESWSLGEAGPRGLQAERARNDATALAADAVRYLLCHLPKRRSQADAVGG